MLILSGVSNTCLFEPAPNYKLNKGFLLDFLFPNYKLNKGFFLGFLFKPLGGLLPLHGFSKKASEKYPLFITCPQSVNFFFKLHLLLNHSSKIRISSHEYSP